MKSNYKEGYYGQWGGQFIPEALMAPVQELQNSWKAIVETEEFKAELAKFQKSFIGRETPLHFAANLSKQLGFELWLKREDLCHTGAHKINNAIGQVLLAKKMGKTRVIAETGAGQHGVATAAAAAALGMECVVYMGKKDTDRQALNLYRMDLLGAQVVPVDIGAATLKEAMSQAMRDWVTCSDYTHYVIGSAAGPHPYPALVAYFQSIIGNETLQQFRAIKGQDSLPDAVVACVGGGSNAIGMFRAFIEYPQVELFGIEAGGNTQDGHCRSMQEGSAGVLHGFNSLLLQSSSRQVADTHSVAAGLDYPGVGPEHAWLQETGRASYFDCTDAKAITALRALSQSEGIIPALESSHAFGWVMEQKQRWNTDQSIVINLSGRGDKDIASILAFEQLAE